MTTKFKINKIVLLKRGCDTAFLVTDLPPSIWPYNENVRLKFELASDLSEKYLAENFPDVPVEIIDIRRNENVVT